MKGGCAELLVMCLHVECAHSMAASRTQEACAARREARVIPEWVVVALPVVEAQPATEAGHVVCGARVEEASRSKRLGPESGSINLRDGLRLPCRCAERVKSALKWAILVRIFWWRAD